MKNGVVIAATLLLAACSSSVEETNYYQLPTPQQNSMQPQSGPTSRLLWVEQVSVPDYLAGNGVVYQTSEVKYAIGTKNLWASPLDQQLRTTLVANLTQQLPGWVVASTPLGTEQDTLNVSVTGFHGRYDGRVIVSGEWLLNHQGQLIKRPFHIEMTQQQDGYDAMVKVLGDAWRREAVDIARELNRLP